MPWRRARSSSSGATQFVEPPIPVLLIVAGLAGLFFIVSLLTLDPAESVYLASGNKELLFRLLWGVVAASFAATGISLLIAAAKKQRTNIVPGPTLYILGVALVVIAMILVSDGGIVGGAVTGVAGMAMMWLEYRSKHI